MFVRNTAEVQTQSLNVEQKPISMKNKTAGNYFVKRFNKCAKPAEFLSYYGLLFAALVESDCDVYAFTPRPFTLKVLGKPYVPDFMIARQGRREVIELARKPTPDPTRILIKDFLERNSYTYAIVSFEEIKKQQTKAESWLTIISLLVTTRHMTTTDEEDVILHELTHNKVHTIADVISAGDRQGSLAREIALFRLLLNGCIIAQLDIHPIDYSTPLSLC